MNSLKPKAFPLLCLVFALAASIPAHATLRGTYDLEALDEVRSIPLVVDDNGTLTGMEFQWRCRDSSLVCWPFRCLVAMPPTMLVLAYVNPQMGVPDHWTANVMTWGAIARLVRVPWIAFERVFMQRWQDGLDRQTVSDLKRYQRPLRRLLFAGKLEYLAEDASDWVPATPLHLVLRREPEREHPTLHMAIQYGHPDPTSPDERSQLIRREVPLENLRPRTSFLATCAATLARGAL